MKKLLVCLLLAGCNGDIEKNTVLCDGKVTYVNRQNIKIQCDDGKSVNLHSSRTIRVN